jgi:hypothetical protein
MSRLVTKSRHRHKVTINNPVISKGLSVNELSVVLIQNSSLSSSFPNYCAEELISNAKIDGL